MDVFKHKKLDFKVSIKKKELHDVLIELIPNQPEEMVHRYMDTYQKNWFHWLTWKKFFKDYEYINR